MRLIARYHVGLPPHPSRRILNDLENSDESDAVGLRRALLSKRVFIPVVQEKKSGDGDDMR